MDGPPRPGKKRLNRPETFQHPDLQIFRRVAQGQLSYGWALSTRIPGYPKMIRNMAPTSGERKWEKPWDFRVNYFQTSEQFLCLDWRLRNPESWLIGSSCSHEGKEFRHAPFKAFSYRVKIFTITSSNGGNPVLLSYWKRVSTKLIARSIHGQIF